MENAREVIMRPASDFEEARGYLEELEAKLDTWAPHVSLDMYKKRFEAGAMKIWISELAGEPFGALVYEIERGDLGREMVILFAAGQAKGVDLVASIYPWIEHQARELECKSIRFETERRGLVAKMAALGFGEPWLVLRKRL